MKIHVCRGTIILLQITKVTPALYFFDESGKLTAKIAAKNNVPCRGDKKKLN